KLRLEKVSPAVASSSVVGSSSGRVVDFSELFQFFQNLSEWVREVLGLSPNVGLEALAESLNIPEGSQDKDSLKVLTELPRSTAALPRHGKGSWDEEKKEKVQGEMSSKELVKTRFFSTGHGVKLEGSMNYAKGKSWALLLSIYKWSRQRAPLEQKAASCKHYSKSSELRNKSEASRDHPDRACLAAGQHLGLSFCFLLDFELQAGGVNENMSLTAKNVPEPGDQPNIFGWEQGLDWRLHDFLPLLLLSARGIESGLSASVTRGQSSFVQWQTLVYEIGSDKQRVNGEQFPPTPGTIIGDAPCTPTFQERTMNSGSPENRSDMFSMGDDRASGPNGFTAAFFKKAWDVVGGDFTCAIRDFFLQCNIIANRLGDIVSINQSAFVPGHRISDNILLTQELMRNYHRRRGPPRCAFKVDIQKAYDTVDWKFLETILVGFGFHPKMVQWIMVCVSGASYSISVNGNVHGLFKGKHGLRQGDPLSPYLFTLVMEILTLLLQRKVRNSDEFQYHHLCEQQRIINLCFADNLFLFARGHPSLVSVIMDALEEFKQVSGLVPSIPKSTAYFCNVPNAIKASILNSMPFAEGVLPVRYLGVPLISSRLLFRDCKILVEKLESRVNDWRNKFLSLAGRLQLIRSVLSSMHIYWASVFILPSRIVHDLEQLMRGFLWCQGEMKKGKAKVAWDSVCMPKHEGGLGIRRIEDFNIALMATHIWSIFTHRESLWVKWVHTYKLKGRSFWDVPCRGDASWGWRKLLQIRSTIRPFIWHKINNGKSTSVWFDRWTDVCPLKDLLSNRDIVRSGFSLENSVSNLISDGVWRWPLDWLSRFPFLAQLHVPVLLDDMDDVILWRDRDGVLRPFSVACVWDTIRSRADMVYWYNVVWFSHCIPRHAIHMWLVIQQKLKTQDRLRQWDVGPSIDLNLLKCPLCDLVPDSHDHLFFECSFSSQVWSKVRVLCGMDAIPPHLSDVVAFIVPLSKGKTVVSIISRIVVAATSYYIWLERNGRLFKKKTSTPGQIVDVIFSTVRLKLVTFKFKKMSTKSRLLLDQWKIPSYCIVHDGSTRQPYLDLYCSYRVAAGLRDARLIICSHLGLCLV
ncbi:putative RNA-directed DNA polymerase, eukaryota, reverse transcriptase zinc-binding domain protein, partial [Tanacetum coccineum]